MKIFHAGIQLSDWEDYPAQNVSVNGQTVFEAVDIVRAAAKRIFHRGNDLIALTFTVRREFASLVACQKYLLTHFSTLPKFGLCQVVCGPDAAPEEVLLENAVLAASPLGTCNGVEAIVQYTIQAGKATTGEPSDFLLGGEGMILRNKTAITSGAESVAVVFSESFPPATNVVVNATVAKPNGGANIIATVRDDLVSVDGFTVELSGPTPNANYKLNWAAYGV